MTIRALVTCLGVAALSTVWAQDAPTTLTLDDALRTAFERNGTVRAAALQYRAAQASNRAAFAAFLPTMTPSVTQENGRIEQLTGPNRGATSFDTTDASLSATWLLLDNGSRDLSYRRSRTSKEQTEFTTLDTLRSVLFSVHQSFYNALRAQELLRVQAASVTRSKEILDRAVLREEVGAGPKKDILQARADFLNSQVNELQARNQVATSQADLKAVIGWEEPELPVLAAPQSPSPQMTEWTLQQAFDAAMASRPSLLAARKRVDLARLDVDLARRDSLVDLSLSANYRKSFSESTFDRSALVLQASIPLFDGNRSRENLRAAGFSLEGQRQSLIQSERDVRAEVESTYKEFAQNIERLRAAELAREAARLNYQAAADARQEGAAEIIEELTAQVSLVTAEANFVQAYYDLLIAEVRLRLVTGQPLPGEVSE
jgi:outer membrane protein